jgi:hypothetical protein
MASIRVTEILAAVRAGSPDGSAMAGGLVHACARSLPVSGVGLALRTAKGPAGSVVATDGGTLAAGVAAVFAFPRRVGAIHVGVLDLYRDAPGVLEAAELTEALSYADAATLLLLDLQTRADGEAMPLDALAVSDDRAEVHRATGMLSVRAGIGPAEALSLLHARAFAEQRSIRDLAHDVVRGTVDPTDEGDDP